MPEKHVVFRLALGGARILFWVYRRLKVSDFVAAVTLSVLSVSVGITALVISREVLPYEPTYRELRGLLWATVGTGLASVLFTFCYLFRLRIAGIVGVDAETSKGLDYKLALQRVATGFDFLGIGAAKLTKFDRDFEDAVGRVVQSGGQARLLLCDPRGAAIPRLEELASVEKGRYIANVQQSFVLLARLKRKFSNGLQIRLYVPAGEDDLPPMRLMFLNGALCLVSPNVFGVGNEGRTLQQVHFDNRQVLGSKPTLYMSLKRTFETQWSRADVKDVSAADFSQIAAIEQR